MLHRAFGPAPARFIAICIEGFAVPTVHSTQCFLLGYYIIEWVVVCYGNSTILRTLPQASPPNVFTFALQAEYKHLPLKCYLPSPLMCLTAV